MSIEEAIKIIQDSDSSFVKCVEAADVLVKSDATPLVYLLECLKRTGLPAEIAAMKLYKRTKRPGPATSYEFVASYENWSNYLKEKKLL